MIVFLDTSALVKLYLREAHSEVVKSSVARSEAVGVCRIAWAEFHAALARRAREVPADADGIELAKRKLSEEWAHYLILEVSQPVVQKAGEYADVFALRGYDAVHLAAAAEAGSVSELPLTFACFDRRLNRAANLLGMSTLDPDQPQVRT